MRAVLGLQPDVLVLDLNMPGELTSLRGDPRDGQTAVAENARSSSSPCRKNPDLARQALRAGAVGYVLKDVRSITDC